MACAVSFVPCWQNVSGGILHHSEGAAHYQACFRLLVFRPLIGEVLKGSISRSTEYGLVRHLIYCPAVLPGSSMQAEKLSDTYIAVHDACRKGIYISLKFFEDIFIPGEQMQPGSEFRTAENAWCWQAGAPNRALILAAFSSCMMSLSESLAAWLHICSPQGGLECCCLLT